MIQGYLMDRAISWTSSWPTWLRYAATTFTVCAVGFIWERFDTERPYLVFFPTIIFCAIIFNRGSGFVATMVATFYSTLFLLPPIGSSDFNASDRFALPLFILVNFAIAAIIETLRTRVEELRTSENNALNLASEKQLLLDELAHRTRNDLTSVVTLINLQAAKLEGAAHQSLKAAAERVRTIARVHRRLEISDQRVVVNSKEFLEDLCSDLRFAALGERPIGLTTRIESHLIGIEKAVPLGLIVNELVTNAAKHAFPDGRSGQIHVSFRRDGVYILCVSDDGVGLVSKNREGMGSQLIRLLAGQLGSSSEIEAVSPASGTKVFVRVPVKMPTMRAGN